MDGWFEGYISFLRIYGEATFNHSLPNMIINNISICNNNNSIHNQTILLLLYLSQELGDSIRIETL